MIKTTIKLIDYCTPVLNSINNCIKQMDIAVSEFNSVNRAAFGGGSERVYAKNLDDITPSVYDIDDAISSVVKSTDRLGDVAGILPGVFDDVNKSIHGAYDGTNRLNGAFGGLFGAVKSLAVSFGAIFSAKAFVGAADEISGISARISNAFNMSGAELDNYLAKIYDVANESRGVYTDIAGSISKLGMQAKNAFGDPEELLRFSDILNKTFAISGTDAMGISSTMYNLTQALASGVLRGQDLNAVMSNAPLILEKVAEYLGTDISMIRKLAEEGRLSSDVIKNAMLGASDEINESFNNMPVTFNQVINRLRNAIVNGLSGAFVSWSELLNADEFQAILSFIGSGFSFIGEVIEYGIGLVSDILPVLMAVADAVWPIVAAFTAWKVETIALNVALNANPIVLLITIVLSLIVMLIKYWDGFSEKLIGFFNVVKVVIGGIISAVSSLILGAVQLVLHAVQGMINIAIKGINLLIKAANLIPGINISTIGEVSFADSFDNTAQGLREGIVDALMTPVSVEKNNDVLNNANSNVAGGYGGVNVPNYSDQLNGIAGGVNGINDKLDRGVEVKNEDIKNLADLMFNRAIRNVSLGEVHVKVDNTFGDIHENADADEIAARIADGIVLSINTSAIGV